MSELEEYKKRQRELVASRKIKSEMPDGVLPEPQYAEHIEPKTLKEKWQNYWYHYKWLTIGLFCLVVFGGFAIWQFAFPQRYDAALSIATEWPMEAYQPQIAEPVKALLEDSDGNGKIELELQLYQMSPAGTSDTSLLEASNTRLLGNLSRGEYFLYLVDDAGYEFLKESGALLVDLSGDADAAQLDGTDRYRLEGTALGEQIALDPQLGNFTLCFLDPEVYGDRMEDKNIHRAYEQQWELFQALLSAK